MPGRRRSAARLAPLGALALVAVLAGSRAGAARPPHAPAGRARPALIRVVARADRVSGAHAARWPVDGISDQSLASWGGGFASSSFAAHFRQALIATGQIRYARYVIQWNAFDGDVDGEDAPDFVAWCRDVTSAGLIPDLAFTNYEGRGVSPPASPAEYERELRSALQACPALRGGAVEAWNEPNIESRGLAAPNRSTSYEPPRWAALQFNAAYRICHSPGDSCTAIAGDFLDAQPAARLHLYELGYERYLDPADPGDWGIHPYRSVNSDDGEGTLAPVLDIVRWLPPPAAANRLWLTEAAAYRCVDGQERDQARAARTLMQKIIPALDPVHVFYYGLMFKDGEEVDPPGCAGPAQDSELYSGAGVARAAARIILGEA